MFGDTPLGRRSNSTSRSSKQVPGSELSFSLGPQPTFRLLGPLKSSPKLPLPDSRERLLSVFWQPPEVPSLCVISPRFNTREEAMNWLIREETRYQAPHSTSALKFDPKFFGGQYGATNL